MKVTDPGVIDYEGHHRSAACVSPADEVARLAALRRYCVLDTGREARFDDLTELAASICATPVALVSLVDVNRLFFKAAYGFDAREVPYPDGFCAHAIQQQGLFEIRDTHEDPRFARHPLVVDAPAVRFYAGMPLFTQEGFGLGTLCVIDFQPRKLDAQQREMLRLLAKQVMAQLDLGLQTMRDPLTGLYNRRALEESLHREVARARRRSDPISVIAIDADHFKRINDTYGHDGGDGVLRALARLLLDSVREEDVACRLGGEEFVVILPGMGKDGALERAETVRHAIQRMRIRVGAQTIQMTASVGVAVFPEHGETEADLLRAADAALYGAKSAGRNRVAVRTAEGDRD